MEGAPGVNGVEEGRDEAETMVSCGSLCLNKFVTEEIAQKRASIVYNTGLVIS